VVDAAVIASVLPLMRILASLVGSVSILFGASIRVYFRSDQPPPNDPV